MATSRYARGQYGGQASTARGSNVNLINIIAETYRDTSDRLDRNAEIFAKIASRFDNVRAADRQLAQADRQLAQKDREFSENKRQFDLKLKQGYDLARKQLAAEWAKINLSKQNSVNQRQNLADLLGNNDKKETASVTTNYVLNGENGSSYDQNTQTLNFDALDAAKLFEPNSTQQETVNSVGESNVADKITQPAADIDDDADAVFVNRRS